jgi:hypothetical protein
MRRLFWAAAGAAIGIVVYQRSGEAIERARDRGALGNLAAAAGATTRLAGAATRTLAVASEQGAKLAGRFAPSSQHETPGMSTQPTEHLASGPHPSEGHH